MTGEPDRELIREHYELVGRIAVTWSLIEGLVKNSIWGLLKLDRKTGSAITDQFISFRLLVGVFQRLSVEVLGLDEAQQAEMKMIIRELEGAQGARNRVVHSEWWAIDDDGEDLITVIANYKSDIQWLSVDDLASIYERVYASGDQLRSFLDAHSFPKPLGPPPSPDGEEPGT